MSNRLTLLLSSARCPSLTSLLCMNHHSDGKAGGRGRKKLLHRKEQQDAYSALHSSSSSAHRTNGFANLNLSGLNSSYVSDSFNESILDERGNGRKRGAASGKGLPPSRKNGARIKSESGLTPAVGGIHLNPMADLSPSFLGSPNFLYGQTPNGESPVCGNFVLLRLLPVQLVSTTTSLCELQFVVAHTQCIT